MLSTNNSVKVSSLVFLMIFVQIACGLPFSGGSSLGSVDIPSYPRTKSVQVSEEDLAALVAEVLVFEDILYESETEIFWVEDTGRNVQDSYDDKLPDDSWRVENDWENYDTLSLSIWRNGDFRLYAIVVDNLDSDDLSDVKKAFGLTGPEPGGTLVILHLIDTSMPVPDLTATEEASTNSANATSAAAESAANATSGAIATVGRATEVAQGTAAARAEIQQTLITFSDEFNSSQLSENWEIYRPDPQKWDLISQAGSLHIVGTPARDSGILNIFGIRLPPSDIQVVSSIETHNMLDPGDSIWTSFSPDEVAPGYGFTISLGLSIDRNDGYYIYMWACPREDCFYGAEGVGEETIGFTGKVYLRLVREGFDYTGYYSLDGNAWTYVGEYNDFPIIVDQITIGAASGRQEEFDAYFDFIRFDAPESQ